MPTVITDKTDAQSIEQILLQFKDDEQVDIISNEMSPIEKAIIFSDLKITKVVLSDVKSLVFQLSNGTIIERPISHFGMLSGSDRQSIEGYEIVGDGVIWPNLPGADISLKSLIQDELQTKYSLDIA